MDTENTDNSSDTKSEGQADLNIETEASAALTTEALQAPDEYRQAMMVMQNHFDRSVVAATTAEQDHQTTETEIHLQDIRGNASYKLHCDKPTLQSKTNNVKPQELETNIKCGILNVCGLKRRLEYPNFVETVNEYDFFFTVESKLDVYDHIRIQKLYFSW